MTDYLMASTPQNSVPRISDSSRWFHPRISGKEAEDLLKTKGYVGSFLVRESRSKPGNYTLSVRRENDVIHVQIQNNGDYYDISTGSEFASLIELVSYYTEQGNPLRELNGNLVDAKFPLYNNEPPTSDLWFHGGLAPNSAENLLKQNGIMNSFLVRERTKVPGELVLCVLTGTDVVKNILIQSKDGEYFVKASFIMNKFKSLNDLVEYYKTKPIVEGSGDHILLGTPVLVGVTSSKEPTEAQSSQSTDHPVKSLEKPLEEFEHLQKQECLNKASRSVGQKPENKEKNRYRNILPFDKTRVIFNDGQPSDYINANYIKYTGSRLSFIATQGCLAVTVPDFWRMIWQEGSQIIAMITNLIEQGKNKCSRYWPESSEKPNVFPLSAARISVKFVRKYRLQTDDFEIRELLLVHETEKSDQPGEYEETGHRSIYHYNYTAWPDKSVPKSPHSLVDMVLEISQHQRSLQRSGPIVTHCSAGIGRTGTFIAIGVIVDHLQRLGAEDEVKVKDVVATIRKQRSGMVQTEMQYKFIYDAVDHYKKEHRDSHLEENQYANVSTDHGS